MKNLTDISMLKLHDIIYHKGTKKINYICQTVGEYNRVHLHREKYRCTNKRWIDCRCETFLTSDKLYTNNVFNYSIIENEEELTLATLGMTIP